MSLHQSHRLPWDSVTKHLTYVDNVRGTTHRPFLNLLLGPTNHVHDRATRKAERAMGLKDFQHFARVLRDTIKDFSATEKIKIDRLFAEQPTSAKEQPRFSFQWDQRPEFIPHSKLYSDLSSNMSSFSYWKDTEGSPTTISLPEVDVVKHLINLDTPESLLVLRRLAKECPTTIRTSRYLCWGHHFGWSRIAEHALFCYIMLNVLIDKTMHCNGKEWLFSLPGFEWKVRQYLLERYDGCEQNVPDRAFFSQWTADSSGLELLQRHIRQLFRRLYVYDWLVNACGGEVDWLDDIKFALCAWRNLQGKPYDSFA